MVLEAMAGSFSREGIDNFFPDKDIVIVEGAKEIPLPRVWVGPPEGAPPEVKGIFAFYDYKGEKGDGIRTFASGQEGELGEKILEIYGRAEKSTPVSMYAEGKKIPLKPFLSAMLAGCLSGLVLPLKGVNLAKGGVAIFLKRRR